jgi:DNA-3-methyladenine glycosylase II
VKIEARPPFRLDLTANVLRRLSTNVVDVLTPDGVFVRALEDGSILEVTSVARNLVEAHLIGRRPARPRAVKALVTRMFGLDRDLTPFYRAVRAVPWLAALARRMRGVKPPRYPSLWEAIVNAVVFQQVSLVAASAILCRLIEALARPVAYRDATLYPFPSPEAFLRTPIERLRGCGLSASKAHALHELGRAIPVGTLDERVLESLPTAEVLERLVSLRGIGPWTASVVALRGLGRLDVFPLGDAGIGRTLPALAGGRAVELAELLAKLGEQRGMLYYHVLLGRLEADGIL